MLEFIFFVLFLGFFVFLLPGISLSRLFKGEARNNFFFWLLFSFLIVPFLYTFLAYINFLNIQSWVLLNLIFLLFILVVTKLFPNFRFDFTGILPKQETSRLGEFLLFIISIVFLVMLTLPRGGLLQGRYPIGDDRHQIGKIVSVAASPDLPLFYRFPITKLTIYYFENIPSGLLVKFSENKITANQAWFFFTLVQNVLMLWLINLLGKIFFTKTLSRAVVLLFLTFVGGLEFYLAGWRGLLPSLDHLEWWTDWWGKIFFIHMQISNSFTLFFWVPQHLFAGLLSIPLYLVLISKQRDSLIGKIIIALVLAAALGYSAFVFASIIVSYLLYYLVRLVLKRENLVAFLKNQIFVGALGILLSFEMLNVIIFSEKQSYFSLQSNVFWFLQNNVLPFKLVNFILTVPYFLIVELGMGALVIFGAAWLFFKNKVWRENIFFWYLLLFIPGIAMFFIRAADDNNISMRSFITAQVSVALLAGFFIEKLWDKFTEKKFLFSFALLTLLLISLPSTLFEFQARFKGQFITTYGLVAPIFTRIDKELPLNSIVFGGGGFEKGDHDSITALSHRFTFKPISHFNVTDLEYAARSKLNPFNKGYGTPVEIEELILQKPEISKNYELYLLSVEKFPLKIVDQESLFKLYRLP